MWWFIGRKSAAEGTNKDIRFDSVDIDLFRNFRAATNRDYLWMWIVIFLSIALLASDCYTCVNLLVFNRWALNVAPIIPYRISRWIFAACILASLSILCFNTAMAIRTYRTRVVSLNYIDPMARNWYSVKNFSCFCLFNGIATDNFFDWCVFYIFFEVNGMIPLVVCDGPRQVINGLLIYSTLYNENESHNLITAIKLIANVDNTVEAAVLSFMTLSVTIWLFFFLKLVLAIVLAIPICCMIEKRGYAGFHAYYVDIVNEKVERLVAKYDKYLTQRFYNELRSSVSDITKPEATVSLPQAFSETSFTTINTKDAYTCDLFSSTYGVPPYTSHKNSFPYVSMSDSLSKSSRRPPMYASRSSKDRLVGSTENLAFSLPTDDIEKSVGPIEPYSVLDSGAALRYVPRRQVPLSLADSQKPIGLSHTDIPLQILPPRKRTDPSLRESLRSPFDDVEAEINGIHRSEPYFEPPAPTRTNTDLSVHSSDRYLEQRSPLLEEAFDDNFAGMPKVLTPEPVFTDQRSDMYKYSSSLQREQGRPFAEPRYGESGQFFPEDVSMESNSERQRHLFPLSSGYSYASNTGGDSERGGYETRLNSASNAKAKRLPYHEYQENGSPFR
ncbi:hypothetical protein BABINDRAFT_160199 [Babjeviella inositovora NRRL Y-12698]|uniref:Vacuolar membrane protein n=1 Tax=Babjeviella inositovora NRRL Y-12698 TaxID=984486 RepID=A0A1E3QWC7_9ASCO|nr:uncharacterized protein BABINDRAFT_160199 [Babjeviella inositovora NRRL Y-12698]ODQ81983.1 hypothetical protein BABINDRAFT_160199 [Babjeviella inositovora NRRL Y-12698]